MPYSRWQRTNSTNLPTQDSICAGNGIPFSPDTISPGLSVILGLTPLLIKDLLYLCMGISLC